LIVAAPMGSRLAVELGRLTNDATNCWEEVLRKSQRPAIRKTWSNAMEVLDLCYQSATRLAVATEANST
jgi:hypothetical protein